MIKNTIIAIDGPAGSGKSTAAKMLAERLDYLYMDTGAMYRAITYLIIKENILDDLKKIIELVQDIDLKLKFENGETRVFVKEEELTQYIRSPEVNANVSEVSAIPEVRAQLVRIQKEIAFNNSIVAEGRDTTTVVFPHADIKIYLTASFDERAERRYKEFKEKQIEIDLEEVKENIQKRDKIDSGRDISPLTKADDAIEIDTTNLPIEEEINLIIEKIKQVIDE